MNYENCAQGTYDEEGVETESKISSSALPATSDRTTLLSWSGAFQ